MRCKDSGRALAPLCLHVPNRKVFPCQIHNCARGNDVWSSPAVAGGRVYVGSLDDKVYCLNAATGAFVWNYMTGGAVYSSPAVVSGLVYVGSMDGNVYCLNATSGALVWSYKTAKFLSTNGVSSSPAVVNRVVYVGSEGSFYAFSSSASASR